MPVHRPDRSLSKIKEMQKEGREGREGFTVLVVMAIVRVLQRCLNENSLHRPICLNTWSQAGETAYEGLSGMTLLEEVGLWVRAVRFQKPGTIPSHCACGSSKIQALLLLAS